MPNGIIREYEVCYRLTDIMQYCNSTGMKTNFTTPADLELGKEFNITVKAYTSVGPGEPTSVKVSTLHKPSKDKMIRIIKCIITNDPGAQLLYVWK